MPAPPSPIVAPGLQASALDLIKSSLRLLNVLAAGEVPTGDEANDALLILNQMIDAWQAQRLMVFTIPRQVFSLTEGQQAYQIGTGAPDFDVPRPASIDFCGIISTTSAIEPLELPIPIIGNQEWSRIPVKDIGSALPQKVWDDGGYPFRTLNFWPYPNVSGLEVALYGWAPLQQFMSLTQQYMLPPAYMKAIRYNLALDLGPEFGRQVPPEVAAQAVATMAAIKAMNIPAMDARCDPAITDPASRIYNWLTDNAAPRD